MRMTTEKQTKTDDEATRRRVVLVGTYRGDQPKDWPGWYCWPLDDDVSTQRRGAAENAKENSRGAADSVKEFAQSPQRSQRGLDSNDVFRASPSPCDTKTWRTLRTSREAIPEWLPCGVDYGRKLKETA